MLPLGAKLVPVRRSRLVPPYSSTSARSSRDRSHVVDPALEVKNPGRQGSHCAEPKAAGRTALPAPTGGAREQRSLRSSPHARSTATRRRASPRELQSGSQAALLAAGPGPEPGARPPGALPERPAAIATTIGPAADSAGFGPTRHRSGQAGKQTLPLQLGDSFLSSLPFASALAQTRLAGEAAGLAQLARRARDGREGAGGALRARLACRVADEALADLTGREPAREAKLASSASPPRPGDAAKRGAIEGAERGAIEGAR